MDDTIRVAELFAGVGGFRLGLEGYKGERGSGFSRKAAGPYETVWANQWEPPGNDGKQFAARCYQKRWDDGTLVVEDIHKVIDDYRDEKIQIPDFDMLVGGFPCFVAGTPVLTKEGYKPIEDIEVGDEALTHMGRFRRVVRTGVKEDAPLVSLRCCGSEPITCTPNHPFMVRSLDGDSGKLGELHEHPAADMVAGRDFVMMPQYPSGEGSPSGHAVDGISYRAFDEVVYAAVLDVSSLDRTDRVYNFEVEEDHTYIVDNAVVHNCQSYSVAQIKSRSRGIEGEKGILWWDIYNMLLLKQPRYLLLENVDRLLLSPSSQKGRDFAIILSCLAKLGYSVEWRVINAADYGFVQKRRRVYIYGVKTNASWDLAARLEKTGIMAKTFPILPEFSEMHLVDVGTDVSKVSGGFGVGAKKSVFGNAGAMSGGIVFTAKVKADYKGDRKVLGDILVPESEVPDSYYVDDESQLALWKHQRVSKKLERTTADGHTWFYSEGAMAFPDPLDKPARTILTGGGTPSPSRMKHIIEPVEGRYRRLVPDELDQIQDFPKGWTGGCGMTDSQRAFCAGNALVVGIPHLIGKTIAQTLE